MGAREGDRKGRLWTGQALHQQGMLQREIFNRLTRVLSYTYARKRLKILGCMFSLSQFMNAHTHIHVHTSSLTHTPSHTHAHSHTNTHAPTCIYISPDLTEEDSPKGVSSLQPLPGEHRAVAQRTGPDQTLQPPKPCQSPEPSGRLSLLPPRQYPIHMYGVL